MIHYHEGIPYFIDMKMIKITQQQLLFYIQMIFSKMLLMKFDQVSYEVLYQSYAEGICAFLIIFVFLSLQKFTNELGGKSANNNKTDSCLIFWVLGFLFHLNLARPHL